MDAVASYIAGLPDPVQQRLRVLMKVLHAVMPEAELCIRYSIPTLRLGGKNALHFAGFKNHVSLFPGAVAIAHFAPKLKAYKVSKGTVQFPHEDELPVALITEIARWQRQALTGRP